ncbi:MAG: extracellular solute-binding protein [Ruminococcaceae bacterium]|nr:extracellular solute-binding protein [Oscillospiraceae bacterium]
MDELMAGFEAATGIKVAVEYLDYQTGDDKVNTAIEGGVAPDVIMEGPERLVANWGAKGVMVDIADLYDDAAKANLIPSAMADCFLGESAYEYPLCVNAFCMGINKTVFEAADAMQYINEETHTWKSVDDFIAAMDAVYAHTGKQVGAVFCGGQGGDQGTRELVKHLKGGSFTNPEHTEYTWASEENIEALTFLANWDAVEFDPSIVGGDEIALFYNGTLNVAFCWNAAQQTNPNTANTGAGLTANGDEIMYMAFPADDVADVRLGCQNYGFGIFNTGDESKILAAKEFIKYFCAGEGAPAAVRATNNFPADMTIEGVYEGHEAEEILNSYNANMLPLAADYYQATTGWAEARTCWWNMLQEVGASDGTAETITGIVEKWAAQANGQ